MDNQYFIAIYTHTVKNYCDEAFFENVRALSGINPVYVIDNSPGQDYYNKLSTMFRKKECGQFHLFHLDVPQYPKASQFQRNVRDSVNRLRHLFVTATDLPYFLILESDVVPPADLLKKFDESIDRLNNQDPGWGVLGGLYYPGFHHYDFDSSLTTLERTPHCLSGCTVYKRALIEKYPFRYDPDNLGPFPDAFICYDAGGEYSFWNDHRILCDHLHNPVNGLRVT